MDKKTLDAVLRTDLYSYFEKSFYEVDNSEVFVDNWHIRLIADKLKQCVDGKIKRLIINLPPRSLKSHCISIAFPTWLLGKQPNSRIVCVSYSQDLANKLSRNSKKLMESDFYKRIFQTRLNPNKQTESEFETTINGFRFATSVGATLTGIGGNYIIIDDPIKADDANSQTIRESVNEWYNNTLISRLNNKNTGVIIVVMQRLHLNDLTGHLLKQDGWELLSLPAISEKDEVFKLSDGKIVGRKKGEALNPTLESLEILENIKKVMTEYNFAAQYQQNPIPQKGNIIDFSYFRFFGMTEIPTFEKVLQSWDVALCTGENNDYSVCVTAGIYHDLIYVLDITRGKWDFTDLGQKIIEMKSRYRPQNVIIEDSPISIGIIQHLGKNWLRPCKYKPTQHKEIRASNQTLTIRSGRVLLLKDASWLEAFKNEILAFPRGTHDDQVDALIQLLDEMGGKPYDADWFKRFGEAAEKYHEEQVAEDYFRRTYGTNNIFDDLI